MDKNQLNNLFNKASEVTGKNANELKSIADSGDISELINSMNPKDAEKLQKIINDPKATEKILATKKAQDILNKLMNQNKD